MSKTVAQLQTIVRYLARLSDLTLTDANKLAIVNLVYRRVAFLYEWPELRREDTTLSTIDGTNKYTWPTTNVYSDINHISISDWTDNNKKKIVMPSRTIVEWYQFKNKPNCFPGLYKRWNDGTNNVVSFAPTPNFTGAEIEIDGLVEPTELTLASSTTVFLAKLSDDALSYLLAATVIDKNAQPEYASILTRRAAEILGQVIGREVTPAEISDDTDQ